MKLARNLAWKAVLTCGCPIEPQTPPAHYEYQQQQQQQQQQQAIDAICTYGSKFLLDILYCILYNTNAGSTSPKLYLGIFICRMKHVHG
jgi:hypothetical protein